MIKIYSTVVIILLSFMLKSCQVSVDPNGRDGRDGNANVRAIIYNVYSGSWKKSTEMNRWFVELNVGEVSPDIMIRGTVLCYKETKERSWEAMPATELRYDNGKAYMQNLNYAHIKGGVDLDWVDTHPRPLPPNRSMKIKMLIIEGTGLLKIQDIDHANYIAVATALELKQNETITLNK